jgi:hypothetical protein
LGSTVLNYRPSTVGTTRPTSPADKFTFEDPDRIRFRNVPAMVSADSFAFESGDNEEAGKATPLSASSLAAKLASLRDSLASEAPPSADAPAELADLRPLLMAQSMAAFGVKSGEGTWKDGSIRDAPRFDYFAA